MILNTPIQPLVDEDKLIWKAENHGNYSVRSAYRVFVNEIVDNFHLHIMDRWNLIWKLKVSPNIKKKCVTRVCRGCFSTRVRLSSRGVHCLIDCVLCSSNYEDSIHVLLGCSSLA